MFITLFSTLLTVSVSEVPSEARGLKFMQGF